MYMSVYVNASALVHFGLTNTSVKAGLERRRLLILRLGTPISGEGAIAERMISRVMGS
jgi:hypothetical protein